MAPAFLVLFLLTVLTAGDHVSAETLQFQQNSETAVNLAGEASGANTICPDGSHCATGQTCCPYGRRYTCCRYNSGTCCANQRHCCPHGCHCDLVRMRCLCTNLFSEYIKPINDVKEKQQQDPPKIVELPQEEPSRVDKTICPDGSSCPLQHTCCPRGRHYACCRFNSGTCCADQLKCCPHGYHCDIRRHRCFQGEDSPPPAFLMPAMARAAP